MEYKIQIIETGIVIVVMIIVKLILTKLVSRRIVKNNFSTERKIIAIKSVNGMILLVTAAVIASIWSVEQKDIWMFISSIITVLGVAFFASWSHLSNITSGLILFFSQNMKVGDTIALLEKDFEIKGKIVSIELLFVLLKTDSNEIISIPNNFFLQKPVRIENFVK